MPSVSQRRDASADDGWSSEDGEPDVNDVSSESDDEDIDRAPVLMRMVHALVMISAAVVRVDLVRICVDRVDLYGRLFTFVWETVECANAFS